LNAGNVRFVSYDKAIIINALEEACFDKAYRKKIEQLKNPFGKGDSSTIIASTLAKINPQEDKWLVKNKLC
jgi:GDP/UDP-N,N'-diacetylbacillosamine 2-epimerase (hydrolysing)